MRKIEHDMQRLTAIGIDPDMDSVIICAQVGGDTELHLSIPAGDTPQLMNLLAQALGELKKIDAGNPGLVLAQPVKRAKFSPLRSAGSILLDLTLASDVGIAFEIDREAGPPLIEQLKAALGKT